VENNSIVAANSRTAPTDKFLIIPVGVEWIEYENWDWSTIMMIIFWS
jgi:hypothetical protein